MNYDALPEQFRDGMRRYVEKGIRPGRFLTCVLKNDLLGACRTADDVLDITTLRGIARWAYSELPGDSRGSHRAVSNWLEKGGIEGGA